ncbi:MAG: hypothetical protein ACNA8P_03670, partial [Phycisphaerales bacterium]
MSCATCHTPQLAFTDGLAIAEAAQVGTRTSQVVGGVDVEAVHVTDEPHTGGHTRLNDAFPAGVVRHIDKVGDGIERVLDTRVNDSHEIAVGHVSTLQRVQSLGKVLDVHSRTRALSNPAVRGTVDVVQVRDGLTTRCTCPSKVEDVRLKLLGKCPSLLR